jgi:hypothetical protein
MQERMIKHFGTLIIIGAIAMVAIPIVSEMGSEMGKYAPEPRTKSWPELAKEALTPAVVRMGGWDRIEIDRISRTHFGNVCGILKWKNAPLGTVSEKLFAIRGRTMEVFITAATHNTWTEANNQEAMTIVSICNEPIEK